ncbi:claudin-4-like [Colossoma macropomum]|uniref:claudin-4-like n=1 Tax=Colossoma macropomum TaxID=42526 RepID=UPI001864A304|nr:claudin-4-like [Colossoma macropomum]
MKIVGIVLCMIGWILAVVTCVLPMWRVTAFIGANIFTAPFIWEGLWMSCVVQSSGLMQCKVYDSILALSSDLQAARAMTVMSIITALLALALSIMSLKCTTCIKGKASKMGVIIISGVFFIIAGILMLIPVSWSTNTIIQDFYNPMIAPSSQRRELGAALYIGVTAAALLILGGGLLCCHCITQKKK